MGAQRSCWGEGLCCEPTHALHASFMVGFKGVGSLGQGSLADTLRLAVALGL